MSSEGKISGQINKFKSVFEKEGAAFVWSFLYFFALLTAYFILRPIRDAMGIASGVGFLPWLFSATFVVMLVVMPIYGALVSRYPRRKFIPYVYLFFALNLVMFWYFFANNIRMDIVAQIFFVWLSVFNVFVVSIFWSFMVDIYKSGDSKVLFGLIASGGTIGGIVGPSIVTFGADVLGTGSLLLISAAILLFAIFCVNKLVSLRRDDLEETESANDNQTQAIGGGIMSGVTEVFKSRYLMGISTLVFLLSLTATFAYFQQGSMIYDAYPNTDERVMIFGQIDLYVSIFAFIFQVFISGPVLSNYGVKGGIIILPIITLVGFALLSISPTIGVFVIFQTLRRASEYGMFVPSRENLFSVVSREQKYKSKNFIDTVVFRGGDVANGWFYNLLNSAMGLSISAIAMIGVPIAAVWGVLAWRLGKTHEEKAS
ncbi:MAG: MFS transporter [Kordiimonadaceae bacterium]|jgi:ATP:ADP antiporter, AAA family|nr:MFS transporter [Kordiimonadaceae bacterium]MBT6037616.1 MFS transporter [Kordiimonadaceae bacterium]MBT6328988.1 MFS transporter [Kordiimonadaceae bacterium]